MREQMIQFIKEHLEKLRLMQLALICGLIEDAEK